jgi:hypothetical protein
VITLPITPREVMLQTPIHVMPHDLSCHILLGRLWIHVMNVVPSTLHRKMKYIYNKKIHMIEYDLEPNSCLNIEKGKENPLKTLTPTTQVEPVKEKENKKNIEEVLKLLEDDWGSLHFTSTFMDDYKIITKKSEKGKEKAVITQNSEDPSKVIISTTL